VGRLVELACYFDREEVVVAHAALDAAGLPSFVFGFDILGAQPDLRGAVGYRIWCLEADYSAANDLLTWRPDDWAPAIKNTRFASAPLTNAVILLWLGLLVGYFRRGQGTDDFPLGPALATICIVGVLLMFGV